MERDRLKGKLSGGASRARLPVWLLAPLLLTGILGFAAPVAAVCSFGGTSALPAPAVDWLRSYRASFQAPAGLAVDSLGRIYVADPASGSVVVRAVDGRILAVGGNLGDPVSIAVEAAGDRIYVGDGIDGRVTAYTPDWQPLFNLGQGNGEFGLPGDIALDPATGDIWVTDGSSHRVEVYDPTGASRFGFGERGTAEGQFQFPAGIYIDSVAGEVLVADQHNGRIQIFDFDGGFLDCLGDKGVGSGRFNLPQGLWVDDLGRIFVADAFEGWVHVIDRLGATVALIADINDVGVGPGKLVTPGDLVIDPSGRLVVSSSTTARIEMFGLDDYVDPESFVEAEVEMRPDVFDPLVHTTVSATIEAPGNDLEFLDLDSLSGNGVPAIPGSATLGDSDGDQTPDVTAVFDGQQLAASLPAAGSGVVRIAGQMGAFTLEGFDAVLVDPSPDEDGDGVPDQLDVCPGFDDTLDADADGVPDACDLCAGADDAVDIDGDGTPDGCDICSGWNDGVDTDTDGVPDGCDRCEGFDDAPDADADGVPDGCDRCPGFDDRLDADADGVPDACDLCDRDDQTGDNDGDGVCADLDCDDTDPRVTYPDACGFCPGETEGSCALFEDGFESGDTSGWSMTVP